MITLVTILGIVAIVLMSSLDCERIKSVQHRGLSITVFFLSFILGAIVLRTIPDRFGLVDNNRCESQIKYVEDKLKAQVELPANILVLDGASYSQYGLDGEQLAHYLSGKGYPTHVLQMTIAGGDQFERYYYASVVNGAPGGRVEKEAGVAQLRADAGGLPSL